jgi:protein-tyrosine phosphatase
MKIDWTGCRNARDLGGLPTADGGHTRHDVLWRSDRHERLNPAAIQTIRAGALRRVVDLRWAHECQQRPSPFAADDIYRHVPMLNDQIDYVPPPDSYAPMLDHNQQRIGAAVRAVAEAPPGGIVVHCHAGRDRTGVLVALLLQIAGVDPATIADDYARTEGCSPQTMLNTLTHLDRQHGGAHAYLTRSGVPANAIQTIHDRLRAA